MRSICSKAQNFTLAEGHVDRILLRGVLVSRVGFKELASTCIVAGIVDEISRLHDFC